MERTQAAIPWQAKIEIMSERSIIWRDKEIGTFTNCMPDMWYLEGTFNPNSSELAKDFTKIVSKQNAKTVMLDPAKGIRARIKLGDELINIAVISMGRNNLLFVRQVISEKGVDWLIKNVPE